MECVSLIGPILDMGNRLWDCNAKKAVYVCNLEDILETLTTSVMALEEIRDDVKRRVELAEERQLRRTNQVNGWLERVAEIEIKVHKILERGDSLQQERCCRRNCWSSYKIGKLGSKRLNSVKDLISKGRFEDVADKIPRRAPVEEIPMQKPLGLETTFDQVWNCLKDESVGTIGLYGMGGVGKTTLLRKINNEFVNGGHDFGLVIWAVVSKEADVKKVREIVRNRLEIADEIWKNKTEDEKPLEIFRVLKSKKFVLLLDDIWDGFDLSDVGVPLPDPQNGSKVIFTTRSGEVCCQMQANTIFRVECLAPEKALELFREKVGEITLNSHPEIPNRAKIVAQECKGLPLALITVGRAMAGKFTPHEWERAAQELKSSPAMFTGMVDQVFVLLKFSYDKLPDAVLKNCFLYCSIFPEDYDIRKDELVELWIGEGLLNDSGDVFRARIEGDCIIECLKRTCLLEIGESEEFVRMHDVIREMALWLAGQKILVQEHAEHIKPLGFENWKEAERLSLWGRGIRNLTETPPFLNIHTLLVRDTDLRKFPSGFFKSMNAIKVLDLSGNRTLTSLSGEIGEAINLQHLNLSNTGIGELPIQLKNLTGLLCLLLNFTENLRIIPGEVISSLTLLQVFSKLPTPVEFSTGQDLDEMSLLEGLDCLQHTKDVSVTISTAQSATKLFNSANLQRSIRRLLLQGCSGLTSLGVSFASVRLEILQIMNCRDLSELKFHLKGTKQEIEAGDIPDNSNFTGLNFFHRLCHLYIEGCAMLDVAWVIYAPSLQTLQLYACHSMEEVIGVAKMEENGVIFSSLTTLSLQDLPMLKSICRQTLPFPSLVEVQVLGCPNLTKLPFDSNTAKNSLKQITGETNWWNGLDRNTRNSFSSKFVHI